MQLVAQALYEDYNITILIALLLLYGYHCYVTIIAISIFVKFKAKIAEQQKKWSILQRTLMGISDRWVDCWYSDSEKVHMSTTCW